MARISAGVVAASLIALTVALYGPLRTAPYVYEDLNVVGRPDALSWRVPSRTLSVWSLQQTTEPGTAHQVNLALHLGNGLLVYGVAATLIPGSAAVWALGAWLLHPLNSAAVSYVSARTDLLLTLGILLAIWAALQSWRWRWGLVGVGLLVATLSKEIGLIGIPLVGLTVWLWRPQHRRSLVWLGLVGAIALLANARTLAGWAALVPTAGGTSWTWPVFLTLQLTALWHLLALIVWPVGFSIDHDVVSVSQAWQMVAVMLTGTALAVVAALWRRTPLLTWGVLWVGVAVLPRLLFRTNEFLTEPQMALPMVGVCLGIGSMAACLWTGRQTPQESYA